MAAPSTNFVNASTAASAGSISIPDPGAIGSTEFVYVAIAINATVTITAPGGWSLVAGPYTTTSGATDCVLRVYRCLGEPSGGWTFTFSTNTPCGWSLISVTGADQSTVQDTVGGAAATAASTTGPNHSATTAGADRLLLEFSGARHTSSNTFTEPTGFTLGQKATFGTHSAIVAYKTQASSGSTGTLNTNGTAVSARIASVVIPVIPQTSVTGTAVSSFGYSGTVAGTREVSGTADRALTFTATASGTREVSGTAVAAYTFTATISGVVTGPSAGAGDGSFGFTATASGTREVSGTANATFALTGTAIGYREIQGVADVTLADATMTAAGEMPPVGAISTTLANAVSITDAQVADRIYILQSNNNGDIVLKAITLGYGVLQHYPSGVVVTTLADTTMACQAVAGSGAVLDVTLAAATCAAVGSAPATAFLARTLSDATMTASGEATGLFGAITATLANATMTASGTAAAIGTLAKTLANATSTIQGILEPRGTIVKTLANATMTASGTASGPAGSWDPRATTHPFSQIWGYACNAQTSGVALSDRNKIKARAGFDTFAHILCFDGVAPMNTGNWPKVAAQMHTMTDQRQIVQFQPSMGMPSANRPGNSNPTKATIEDNILKMQEYASGARDAEFDRAFNGLRAECSNSELERMILRFAHEHNASWYNWGYCIVGGTYITSAEATAYNTQLALAYKGMWERMLSRANTILGNSVYSKLTWSWNLSGMLTFGGIYAARALEAFPTTLPANTKLLLTWDDYIDSVVDVSRASNMTAQLDLLLANPTISSRIQGIGVDEWGPLCDDLMTASTIATVSASMDEWINVWWNYLASKPNVSHISMYEIDLAHDTAVVFRDRAADIIVLPGCENMTYTDATGVVRATNYQNFAEHMIAKVATL